MSDIAVILRITQVNKEEHQTYYIPEPLPDIQQHQTPLLKVLGCSLARMKNKSSLKVCVSLCSQRK